MIIRVLLEVILDLIRSSKFLQSDWGMNEVRIEAIAEGELLLKKRVLQASVFGEASFFINICFLGISQSV